MKQPDIGVVGESTAWVAKTLTAGASLQGLNMSSPGRNPGKRISIKYNHEVVECWRYWHGTQYSRLLLTKAPNGGRWVQPALGLSAWLILPQFHLRLCIFKPFGLTNEGCNLAALFWRCVKTHAAMPMVIFENMKYGTQHWRLLVNTPNNGGETKTVLPDIVNQRTGTVDLYWQRLSVTLLFLHC